MTLNAVISLIKLFEANDIEVWLDGGWGVDSLLGQQTRLHEDLDIAVQRKDVSKLCKLLEVQGYKNIPRNDTSEYNFLLGDTNGNLVDIHVYEFDDSGTNIYGIEYPKESLTGKGSLSKHAVKCIAPEWVVKFHSGYELDENDYHDVKLICEKFKISLPQEYKK